MDRAIPSLPPVVEGLFMALVIFQALQEMCILEELVDHRATADCDDEGMDTLKELGDSSSKYSSDSDLEREEMDLDFEGSSIPDLFEEENEDDNELMNPSSSSAQEEQCEENNLLSDIDEDLFVSDQDEGYDQDSENSSCKKIIVASDTSQENVRKQDILLNSHFHLLEQNVSCFECSSDHTKLCDTELATAPPSSTFVSVRSMIALGADISFNMTDRRQDFAAMTVSSLVLNQNWSGAQLLIQHGGNVDELSASGIPVLVLVILFGSDAMTKFLINNSANVEFAGNNGLSPLCCAVKTGSDEAVRLLLERGCNPNQQSMGGITPLHLAADTGSQIIVRTLLKYRADTSLTTRSGQTAAEFSMRRGAVELTRMLL